MTLKLIRINRQASSCWHISALWICRFCYYTFIFGQYRVPTHYAFFLRDIFLFFWPTGVSLTNLGSSLSIAWLLRYEMALIPHITSRTSSMLAPRISTGHSAVILWDCRTAFVCRCMRTVLDSLEEAVYRASCAFAGAARSGSAVIRLQCSPRLRGLRSWI